MQPQHHQQSGLSGMDGGEDTFSLPLAPASGSTGYMAPELITGEGGFSAAADTWSLGVVLYGVVAGQMPWDQAHTACPAFRAFAQAGPEFLASPPSTPHHHVQLDDRGQLKPVFSPDLQDLLRQLLAIDPSARLSLEGLLSHRWVTGDQPNKLSARLSTPDSLVAAVEDDTALVAMDTIGTQPVHGGELHQPCPPHFLAAPTPRAVTPAMAIPEPAVRPSSAPPIVKLPSPSSRRVTGGTPEELNLSAFVRSPSTGQMCF